MSFSIFHSDSVILCLHSKRENCWWKRHYGIGENADTGVLLLETHSFWMALLQHSSTVRDRDVVKQQRNRMEEKACTLTVQIPGGGAVPQTEIMESRKKEKNIMAKHNVLLVCGSGASSGFMAANIRKAAAARGLEISVNARSEATVEDYVDEIDCLMLGPHLAALEDDMKEICEGYPIKIAIVERDAYAHLDGEKALNQILALFGE